MPPEGDDAGSIGSGNEEDDTPTERDSASSERESTMSDVLKWLGFTLVEQKVLLGHLGDELRTFLNITPKEMDQLSKEISTSVRSKMAIGFKRLKLLKGVIHWAKDKQRIGSNVSVVVTIGAALSAQFEFLEELQTSIDREAIRVESTDSIEARSKAASPGRLKDERNWDKWEQGLILMLSILRGVNGVPLSYVIREEEHKAGTTYNSFLDESIAKVSLHGPQFEADSRTVHQIIETLTSGENATHWLKELKSKNDGRKDMVALRSHYRGAGNQSRRISNAQGLHATLHYKTERAMKFSDFISKVKEMFDIYEDCNEPQPESVKLRFLWEKIESTVLQMPIEIMKADLSRDTNSWTFVKACDHLASLIPADGKSGVKFAASAIESEKSAAKSNIIRNGTIFIGTYSPNDWFEVLTKDERDQVNAERKKGGKPHFGKKNKPRSNQKIQALEKKLKKSKKTISSMKRATKETEDDDTSDSDSSTAGDNAGNAFGGRAEKKRQKKKKKKS
jgi:hypothetical protein